MGTFWSRARWTLYAPLYDRFVRFGSARRRSIEALGLAPGARVLLAGAGTGADLDFVPPGVRAVALDYAPGMLVRARGRRRPETGPVLGDAAALPFAPATFDAVVLHLVLAVADDPAAVLREADRVLRPRGSIAVFDKFLTKERAGPVRAFVNPVARWLATDLNRRLLDIVRDADREGRLQIVCDRPVAFGGLFRIAQLRRAPGH